MKEYTDAVLGSLMGVSFFVAVAMPRWETFTVLTVIAFILIGHLWEEE